jgi:hypothetical protein
LSINGRDFPTADRASSTSMSQRLDELQSEYDRPINSMEFAYAMGASRTLGKDPRLQPVIDTDDAMRREIAALKAEEDEG